MPRKNEKRAFSCADSEDLSLSYNPALAKAHITTLRPEGLEAICDEFLNFVGGLR